MNRGRGADDFYSVPVNYSDASTTAISTWHVLHVEPARCHGTQSWSVKIRAIESGLSDC